jgi:hypothetical protein
MSELRQAFKDAQIIRDAATVFCQATIGRDTPGSNDDAQKLIEALKALTATDDAAGALEGQL